jgi:hypothetical protein
MAISKLNYTIIRILSRVNCRHEKQLMSRDLVIEPRHIAKAFYFLTIGGYVSLDG